MVGNSNNNDDDAFDMITMMILAILPTKKSLDCTFTPFISFSLSIHSYTDKYSSSTYTHDTDTHDGLPCVRGMADEWMDELASFEKTNWESMEWDL